MSGRRSSRCSSDQFSDQRSQVDGLEEPEDNATSIFQGRLPMVRKLYENRPALPRDWETKIAEKGVKRVSDIDATNGKAKTVEVSRAQTEWVAENHTKFIGHTIQFHSTWFGMSDCDCEFKMLVKDFDKDYSWTGPGSLGKMKGMFTLIDLASDELEEFVCSVEHLLLRYKKFGIDNDPEKRDEEEALQAVVNRENVQVPSFMKQLLSRKKAECDATCAKAKAKAKGGSKVKEHFTPLPESHEWRKRGKTHECNICAAQGKAPSERYVSQSGNSTGNLASHLRRWAREGDEEHDAAVKGYVKDNPRASRAYIDSDGQYQTKFTDQTSAKANILLCMAMLVGFIPFTFLSNFFFKEFTGVLNAGYLVMGTTMMTKIIFSLYSVLHTGLKKEIGRARIRYFGSKWMGLQIDLWTDDKKVSYVCLNATFINDKFERINRVLASRVFPDDEKTADNIKAWIDSVLAEYELSWGDVSILVADGGEKSTLLKCNTLCAWQCRNQV